LPPYSRSSVARQNSSSIKPQTTQRTLRQRTKGTRACSCGGPRLATRPTCASRTYRTSSPSGHDHDTGEYHKRFAVLVHTTTGDLSSVFLWASESAATLTIRTVTDQIVVAKNDIVQRTKSEKSLMPEGLLESLTEREQLELLKDLTSN